MTLRLTIPITAALLLAGVSLTGCETSLFPDNLARSPYERYGTLRGQLRPATQQDAYGWDQPALRDRLRPMGER